jgi:opine dehydrogenase
MMNITIIGCGHGGQALAAQLASLGNAVTLHADESHPGYLHTIRNNTITLQGKVKASAKLELLTTDIELALLGAEVIYLSLPTHAHLPQFRKMLPFLKKGQIVITLAGNFSSLYFHQELVKAGKQRDIHLADIASLPYACRAQEGGEVNIIDIKQKIDIAAMPAHDTLYIKSIISGHFPSHLQVSANILEMGLNITSAISHPTLMVTNAGRIGKGDLDFYFYRDGISRDIINVIATLDADRMKIGEIYGFRMPSYLDLMNGFYASRYTSYYDFFTQSPAHNTFKLCPASMQERYLSQDIPYVMLPWYSLGLHAGYESNVMKSLIYLSSALNDTCYFSGGRAIASDFFNGMDQIDIKRYLKDGRQSIAA